MNKYYTLEEVKFNAFYKFPKELLLSKKYKNMNDKSKLLYMVLLDRVSLSIKNRWIDNENKVYIIFTREEAMLSLGIGSNSTVTKIFKELVNYDLIDDHKIGLTKSNIIYVKKIQLYESEIQEHKDCIIQNTKNMFSEIQKVYTTNTDNNNTKYNNKSSYPIMQIEDFEQNIIPQTDFDIKDAFIDESIDIEFIKDYFNFNSLKGNKDILNEVFEELHKILNYKSKNIKICKELPNEDSKSFKCKIMKLTLIDMQQVISEIESVVTTQKVDYPDLLIRTKLYNQFKSSIKDLSKNNVKIDLFNE